MKKQNYDYVILTNIPSFYKIRLWNEIAKEKKILMVLYATSEKTRNADFLSEKPIFTIRVLQGSIYARLKSIYNLFLQTNYTKLFVCGWDEITSIFALTLSDRYKNCIIAESSIHEYKKHLVKDIIKGYAMRRTNICYVPGISHEALVRKLGFKRKVIQTGGCGLLNYYKQPPYVETKEVRSFLFVGRLVDVKNLVLLVKVFNEMPELKLTIVGFGEDEYKLKTMAGSNIEFTGAVDNKDLAPIYAKHDVFLLCSKSETWGLVVEEALNSGLPVIVSDMVGCREDLIERGNGLVFKSNSSESLKEAIRNICDLELYNKLKKNVSKLDFLERGKIQIASYLK